MIKSIILISYFVLILGIGFYSFFKIKKPSDYFVAGKNNGIWQVAGSLLATILGGSAILGSVNLAGTQGWASAWYLIAASIGLWLLIPLVGFVNRKGKFTLANLIGQFYGESPRKAASIIIPVAWTGIVAAQIIAASKILFSFFGITYEAGVFISGGLFIVYTLAGGQVSILKTDFIQSIIILLGLLLTAFFLLNNHQIEIPPIQESFPFHHNFTGIDLLILLLTFSSTFIVGPDIYSRLFCARDEKVARKSVIIVAAILVPFAFLLTLLGVIAYSNLPKESLHGSVALLELINHFLPDWSVGLMAAALLSAVLSSADTTLLTASMMFSELIDSDIDNKKSLNNTRYFIVGIGVFSMLIALKVTSIIGSLLMALAVYSGSFIIPLAAALLNWKVNKQRSILAMGMGGLLALSGKITDSILHLSIGNWMIVAAFVVNFAILMIPGKTNRAQQL